MTQRLTRLDGMGPPALRSQRSSSISNDQASLSVASLAFPPAVQPDPAYIAPSSASQIVTGDYAPALDQDDDDEAVDGLGVMNVRVAPNALSLVNAFLDQLLYSFLASSRSTSIASLKPAVTEVLKPRLAKDAIACADAELQEFLGDEYNDETSVFQQGIEPRGDLDLKTLWRRTRLRCMVYTRLGDLEEEDEEMWIEREHLDHRVDGPSRLSRDLGVVSPAAAIFLTSILEFIGEEALQVSGRAAYTRFEARRAQENHLRPTAVHSERLSVEVVDIEKLAMNTTLGRLWRSWKKKVRSPSINSQRPSSRELHRRPASSLSSNEPRSRKPSIGEAGAHIPDPALLSRASTAQDRERMSEAAAVPLPVSRDGGTGIGRPAASVSASRSDRPRSMILASRPDQTASQPNRALAADISSDRPRLLHNRSSSLPPPAFRQSSSAYTSFDLTPQEGASSVASQKRPSGYLRYDSNPAAVSTMYDGVIDRDEGAQGLGEVQPARQPSLTAQEREMRALDEGLDSLAESSNGHQAVNEQALGNPGQRYAFTASNNNQVNDRGRDQNVNEELPLRVDSKLMQGYLNKNAPLDNREASLVESELRRSSGEIDIIRRGVPDEEASISNGREIGVTPTKSNDAILYASHDHFDGATSATGDFSGQQYGLVPESHPGTNTDSVPSSLPTFAQAKAPVKGSDFRKQLPPVSTGVERAAVQRVSPSPGSAFESPIGRTSTSSSRELRPLHKSGSSASQRGTKLKGLAGRESIEAKRPFSVSTASSEGSGSIALRTPKIEEAQENFEQLINSDETIQYTLTPLSVREMDVSRGCPILLLYQLTVSVP